MNILLVAPHKTLKMCQENKESGGVERWTDVYLQSKIAKNNKICLVNTVIVGKRQIDNSHYFFIDEVRRLKSIIDSLKKTLDTTHIDIAHVNCVCGKLGIIRDYYCIKKIKKEEIKVLVHFHCNVPDWSENKIVKKYLSKILKLADGVVVLNDESEKFIKTQYPGLSIRYIPNFVALLYQKSDLKIVNKNIDKILYVGKVRREKGCEEFNTIAKAYPDKKFVMLGSLHKEAQNISFNENIMLAGDVNQEEVKKYMIESDILIFPSHSEGFPLVILEAMFCGLPIISSAVGAIPEMLGNDDKILVEPGNVKLFLKALDYMENYEARKACSERNMLKAKTVYGNEIIENQFEKIYREITGGEC